MQKPYSIPFMDLMSLDYVSSENLNNQVMSIADRGVYSAMREVSIVDSEVPVVDHNCSHCPSSTLMADGNGETLDFVNKNSSSLSMADCNEGNGDDVNNRLSSILTSDGNGSDGC